jgi:predicted RNase H-like HicB family nuclease
MQYTVFLRQHSTEMYEASTPTVPGPIGQGRTRDEALNSLKTTLKKWLAEIEVTTIELEGSRIKDASNPWLATAGIFKDDPFLEPMLSEIYAARERESTVNQL